MEINNLPKGTMELVNQKIKNIEKKKYIKVIDEHGYNENLFLEKVKKDHILRIYSIYNQNIIKTSKILNISRSTLYRYLKQYGVKL
jgi:transcriptional regulator of acetoin/glycerol metabolism